MKWRQIKLIFLIFWHTLKRAKKRYLFLVLLGLALIFTLKAINFVKLPPKTVSEGVIGTYQEHDIPEVVTRLISRSLVEVDQTGALVPGVSTWETNKDGTEFKFKLNSSFKWTDGTEFSSNDLEFFIPNAKVSYPDNLTILFKLDESFSAFPALLTRPVFKKGTTIGIGPYKISNIFKSKIFITKLELEPMSVNLPKVAIRFYPNEKTALTAFSIGEVHSILGVIALEEVSGNPQVKVTSKINFGRVVSVLYNVSDPFISSKPLRQALNYASPKIENEELAKTPIPPSSWAFNNDAPIHLGDLDKAKGALEKAKESMAEDALDKEIVLTTNPQYLNFGRQIVENWKKLGLNVSLREEAGIPQNFQSLLIAQNIPADPDQYSLWHSTQTKTNLTKYSSPRVDKDLEDGRKTLNLEERKAKYIDFQKELAKDIPATFLFFPKYNIVYLKKAESELKKILPIQLNEGIYR